MKPKLQCSHGTTRRVRCLGCKPGLCERGFACVSQEETFAWINSRFCPLLRLGFTQTTPSFEPFHQGRYLRSIFQKLNRTVLYHLHQIYHPHTQWYPAPVQYSSGESTQDVGDTGSFPFSASEDANYQFIRVEGIFLPLIKLFHFQ